MSTKLNFLNNSWKSFFTKISNKKPFQELLHKIEQNYQTDVYYPKQDQIFRAFELTDFNDCKVIFFGQDPYHQKDKANGLAFSINPGLKISCSLRNMFKELKSDLNIKRTNMDLSDWAKQGVLLLNTILTVKANQAMSCKDWGWDWFIKEFLDFIYHLDQSFVFVLLGNNAKQLKQYINLDKDYVLETSHPCALSYNKGFKNFKLFSKINNILLKMKKTPINW